MDIWLTISAKFVSWLLSIINCGNIRQEYYDQKKEHEIMWTTLYDISRMHKSHPSGEMAEKTLNNIKNIYTRY